MRKTAIKTNIDKLPVAKLTPPQVVVRLKKVYSQHGDKFVGASTNIKVVEKTPAKQRYMEAMTNQVAHAVQPYRKQKKEAVYIEGELAQVVSLAYKQIATLLDRFGIVFTRENGCYWCTAEVADKYAMKFAGAGRLVTNSIDIWVMYDDGQVHAGIEDDSLFTADMDDMDDLPLFLVAYFKSKFGKGYLNRRPIHTESEII